MVLQTTNKKGWFWYIPQHDNIVVVGVVAPFDYLFKGAARTTRRPTTRKSSERPAVKERIAGATRVTGYFVTRDYSYRSTHVAGDGWVLVGDAFGFLDPLYSSGVLLALKSGELAADAIVDGLAKGDTQRRAARRWGADLQRRRRSDAAARVRVLRRLQLRPVRPQVSRTCAGRSPTS